MKTARERAEALLESYIPHINARPYDELMEAAVDAFSAAASERDAEIERLTQLARAEREAAALIAERFDQECNRRCADARRVAIKECVGVAFQECQPNHGEVFGRIDDRLRALLDEVKP